MKEQLFPTPFQALGMPSYSLYPGKQALAIYHLMADAQKCHSLTQGNINELPFTCTALLSYMVTCDM